MPKRLRFRSLVVSFVLANIWSSLVLPAHTQAYQFLPAAASSNPTVTGPISYYIDPVNGKDAAPNDGQSPALAFKTIQHAADLTNPGDTVYLMNGTYTDQTGYILIIRRSGNAQAYITYRNYPGHTPVLHATQTWNHISVDGAAYIRIEGLTIKGDSDNITYDYAYSQKDIANPRTNTNCISISTDYATGTKIPHHIEIRNNLVYNCPAGGIVSKVADYLTVEDNIVHSTSHWTRYGSSGISFLSLVNTDNTTGYKNFIRRNISYDNQMYIPFYEDNRISDGNGIIIDRNDNSTINRPAYLGRTLVENNIVYNNGGSGIHAFHSAHVEIVNNTAYQNNRSPEINEGNIFANYSSDINILNNISYARAGKRTNINYQDTNVLYDYNVYYNGTTPAQQGAHDVSADPLFINPAAGDFRLQPASPAINTGTSSYAPTSDFKGVPRPIGSGFDRGAYEFVPAPTLSQSLSPTAFIPGGTTTLSFTLANPTAATLSNVAFSESFPSQVVLANPVNLVNQCGGTPTIGAQAGANSVSVAGLSLAANQSCTISLKLTSNTLGSYLFTTGFISSDQTLNGATSNALNLRVVIPSFAATPLFGGDTFRIGAVRAGNSKTASLKLSNTSDPVTQLNITYPVLGGSDASRFAIVSLAGDFPLTLTGGASYNFNLSCSPVTTGELNATLSFSVSGPGISSTNYTLKVTCNGAYVVTEAQDHGTVGTLSYALKNVATHPGDGIVFELGSATSISLDNGALLPLQIKSGVVLDVGCSSRLTLVGNSGTNTTLTLQGDNYLVGFILQHIRISANTTGNQIQCTEVNLLP